MTTPLCFVTTYRAAHRICQAALLVLLLAVWAVATGPVQAQPAPSDSTRLDSARVAWTVTLPELSVLARRVAIATVPEAARATVLDSAAIARSGASSVADLLALRSQAFLKQYGEQGLASLSLRGTSGNQSLVLLDGLRVSDPQTGQIDLSLLPTVLLESVAVEHGAGSARYGSGALGGTVHLRTLRPSPDARLRASTTAGAFGARSAASVASGGVTTERGTWSGLVAGRYHTSDGDFAYRNEFLVPARTVEREGASADVTTLYGRASWSGDAQSSWQVSSLWMQAERGLPGSAGASVSTGARQTDRQGRLWVTGSVPTAAGQLQVRGQAVASSLRYVNPPTRTDRTTRTRGADLSATLRTLLGTRAVLSTGVAAGYDAASLREGAEQLPTAAFADASMRAGRLRLEPAVRLDAYMLDGASTVVPSPRLGLTLRPLAWDGLRLKALAARAFRYPTFNERYYEPGGNPDLNPEDGWTVEAGIHTRIQRPAWRVNAEVTAYQMHLTDQIVWRPSFVQSGLKVWQPKNVAQVRTRGLETSLRGQAQLASPVRVRGGASFTHTRAENRSNPTSPEFGAQLPYVPRQQVKSWMGVDVGPVSLDATLRLVGSRYYTSDASQAVPPYQVLDLQAGAEWSVRGATIHARLRLDNALDERYAVVRLYPMPPRHLSARLTVSLAP